MNLAHSDILAQELNLPKRQLQATVALLEDGATVPFIARYRKEATGSLDEVTITTIRDRLAQLVELDRRRETILKTIADQGKLTDALKTKILAADALTVLEDLYLPYKPKRRTRATIAKEKGLEPLAQRIWEQGGCDPAAEAVAYIDPAQELPSVNDVLAGARDIMAEWVSEDQQARTRLRTLFLEKGTFHTALIPGKETAGSKFADYFAWEEPVATAPSHRILAMRHGEKEEILTFRVLVPEDEAVRFLESLFVKRANAASQQVKLAVQDSFKRLVGPSMETEVRLLTKKRADEAAIAVFADNLRQLLLAPPLGQKNVLAIDPGFRTGCKVVCLDRQGKFLHTTTIYPHQGEKGAAEAGKAISALCEQFASETIAVGNGTAGRETESFLRKLALPRSIPIVMVNESGASIYSASEVARQEFPDQDVTVRGAVSIGRRLMDPLAELVKLDAKSIGVGQYQHDVDQIALKNRLDDVVMSCVNSVGVEVNTASEQLLTYASGLGPQLAHNIVAYRNAHGPFQSRAELLNVQRLGPKAFEQSAGFLRIRHSKYVLDGSAVHPERYALVETMAHDVGCAVTDLMRDEKLRKKINPAKYVSDQVGLPTLNDILAELAKPGRDPREQFEVIRFAEGIEKIEDVKPGMKLPGIVTNITAFGVFVDLGVHQDGLVHISQLADRFVQNPHEVVKVQQKVTVTVLDVDLARKRIALSLRSNPTPATSQQPRPPVREGQTGEQRNKKQL